MQLAMSRRSRCIWGDLLPEDQCEDWAVERREELRWVYHDLLRHLSRLYEERGQYRPAIEVLQRLIASEPAEEGAHRQLMRLYALSGQRHQALQQYDRLREALRREADAEPDAPTRRLVEEIRAGRFPPGASVAGTDNASASGVAPSGPAETDAMSARAERGSKLTGARAGGASPPTNLPRQLSSFVGREREVAEIRSPLSSLVDSLRTKKLLLILDNCEHLLAACAELAGTLLGSCPDLRILATSRRALGIWGEVDWRVPSMTRPGVADQSAPGCLLRYDAVSLFLERTRSVRPYFCPGGIRRSGLPPEAEPGAPEGAGRPGRHRLLTQLSGQPQG
jgi:tetratricopeptide (TPR) repeat protein